MFVGVFRTASLSLQQPTYRRCSSVAERLKHRLLPFQLLLWFDLGMVIPLIMGRSQDRNLSPAIQYVFFHEVFISLKKRYTYVFFHEVFISLKKILTFLLPFSSCLHTVHCNTTLLYFNRIRLSIPSSYLFARLDVVYYTTYRSQVFHSIEHQLFHFHFLFLFFRHFSLQFQLR